MHKKGGLRMNEIISSLVSKDIKVINDFNQISKKIFKNYYIFNNILVCNNEDANINKGQHFAFTINNPLNNLLEDKLLYITTDNIFKTIKDQKKNIKQININDDNELFISGDNELKSHIGKIMDHTKMDDNITQLFINANYYIKNSLNTFNFLSKEIKESLCDNNLIIYKKDDYKFRLTKELIPNLKVEYPINIVFFDIPQNLDLIEVLICVDRGILKSFHKYICIKY
jgi:hypothetical protein